jgi:hypothetical protein
MALVRETVTLSGLEGLGVANVLAFGRLPSSTRRYLVRELVAGTSLEKVITEPRLPHPGAAGVKSDGRDWLLPLLGATDQLTVLHRAGPAERRLQPDRHRGRVDLLGGGRDQDSLPQGAGSARPNVTAR